MGGSRVGYWGVAYTQGSANYEYFISVDTAVCGPSANRQDYRVSNNLPGGNVIRSGSGCIYFSFDNGDAVFDPAGAATIIVGPASGAGCKRLTISASGLIQTDNDNEACN